MWTSPSLLMSLIDGSTPGTASRVLTLPDDAKHAFAQRDCVEADHQWSSLSSAQGLGKIFGKLEQGFWKG